MTPLEVSQFVIAPPAHKRGRVMRQRDALARFLAQRFPDFDFRIVGLAPVGAAAFTIVPVMNYVGDDGREHLCRPAPAYVVADIRRALATFEKISVN